MPQCAGGRHSGGKAYPWSLTGTCRDTPQSSLQQFRHWTRCTDSLTDEYYNKMQIVLNRLELSLPEVKANFGCDKISFHAQKHAEGFYKKLGFVTVSDVFLEEGIEHVTMTNYDVN